MIIHFSNPILARALRQTRSPSLRLTLAGVGGLWLGCAAVNLSSDGGLRYLPDALLLARYLLWMSPMLTFWLAGAAAVREARGDRFRDLYQSPLSGASISLGYGLAMALRARLLVMLTVGILPALAYGSLALGYALALCLLALHALAAICGAALGLRWGRHARFAALLGLTVPPVLLVLRGLNVISANPLDHCLEPSVRPFFQSNFLRLRWLAPAPLPELGFLALLLGLCWLAARIPVRQRGRMRPRAEIAGALLALLAAISGDAWLTRAVERSALVEIYRTNGGEGWPIQAAWLSNAPVCEWEGVVCECGYVSGLTLAPPYNPKRVGREQMLRGKLTPAIGRLTNLEVLSLGGKDLESVPPQIGQLSHLASLNIEQTQLNSLPPQIKHLSQLEQLIVDESNLASLPPEIAQLDGVSKFSIDGNRFSALPPEVYDMPRLNVLSAQGNQLTEISPDIARAEHLEWVYLNDNLLATLPPEFAQLPNLIGATLSNNPLTGLPGTVCEMNVWAFNHPPETC